jgi:hypothetical protein
MNSPDCFKVIFISTSLKKKLLDFYPAMSGRDMTATYACAARGSMHVVGHHNDLFSWKKYNNYIDIA